MPPIRTRKASREKEKQSVVSLNTESFLGIPVIDLVIAFCLMLAVFVIYVQTGSFEFINWDDTLYVTQNPHVQAGLTWDSIKWSMTAVVATNWMPVTLLSHMLDCQLFHMQPGMHHLDNVLLHLIATLLLFASLKRATGARWPAAFVAFFFAVHPLHVESVAWIAERKDVLSICFWFLALYLYVRYTERPAVGRYSLMALAFALGLMAKPMLVTFPFTLLLLDCWPLRRSPQVTWTRLIAEKVPLLLMSFAASLVNLNVQHPIPHPLPMRLANAVVSYAVYIRQFFVPVRLCVLYMLRAAPPAWQTAVAGVLLVAVTAGVVLLRRSRPYLAVGWFWYLGTLVPVIGLVQVGMQSHADRYMYVPMVGLLIMIAWALADWIASRPGVRSGVVLATVVVGLASIGAAYAQTEYWQNSGLLFTRDLELTEGNFAAELNLGNYLMDTGQGIAAIPHYQAALRYEPEYGEAENNIGMILGGLNRMADALPHFEAAARLRPALVEPHYNLAQVLAQMPGREAEAIAQFEMVQRMQPRPEIPAIIEQLRARSPTRAH